MSLLLLIGVIGFAQPSAYAFAGPSAALVTAERISMAVTATALGRNVDKRQIPLALQKALPNQPVEIHPALAALFACSVTAFQTPNEAKFPAQGKFFAMKSDLPVKTTLSLGLTYDLRPRLSGGFHVVDGAPASSFKLTFVPQDTDNPPPRITLKFSFKHQCSGPLIIPLGEPVRPLLDAKGEYTLTDDHRKTLARDFIRVLDKMDQKFDSQNVIGTRDVTVEILNENGNTVDTFTGWLQFATVLTNKP